MNRSLRFVFCSFGFALLLARIALACAAFQAIEPIAQPVVNAACTELAVQTHDGTLHTICAAENELAGILSRLAAPLDAGSAAARRTVALRSCIVIPKRSDVCSSPEELASAIDATNAARKDGGK